MGKEQPRTYWDSFVNLLAGLGVPGRDKFMSQQYIYTPLNIAELETAYRGDWIARKVVDIPAFDMTREWRAWQAEQTQIEDIENCEKKLHLQRKVQMALVKSRLYGGAAIIIGVDQGDPAEPLDLEAIGQDDLKWLHVVPAHQLMAGPLEYDITSEYYAQPQWYQARTSGGARVIQAGGLIDQIKLHPSRVVRFLGMPPPDDLSAPPNWGDSVLQSINDSIKACGLVAGSLATLISELKVDVIKIPQLTDKLMTDAGTSKLTARFSAANTAKSVINTILIDSTEDWQRVQASLTGLPEVIAVYLQIASGAADIPAGRFLGLPHRGLNVTGEADFRNYYDKLASEQSVILTPAMNVLDEVLVRSALGTYPDDIYYDWKSLWQLGEEEASKIAFNKAQAYKIDVDAGQIPTTALAKGRINQLIEDGFYPGLDQAIAEAEAAGDSVEEFNAPAPEPPPPPPGGVPAPPGGSPPPPGGNGGARPPSGTQPPPAQ